MVMFKRAARAVFLSASLFGASLAHGMTSEQYQCYEGNATVCAIESAIYKYTNAFRVQNRVASLKFGQLIGFAARHWSQQQLASGALSHNGFPGARDLAIKTKFGSTGQAFVMAENVARNMVGRSTDDTGKDLVTQWIESEPHRRNLLGAYPVIGVGVAVSGSSVVATQIFGQEK